MPPKRRPAAERFWPKVDRQTGDCWVWTGYILGNGYGRFGKESGVIVYAHRMAYELTFGTIPDGMEVCHTCDNRCCCNPGHLFLGTHRENLDDMMRKCRHNHRDKNPMTKLTTQQTYDVYDRYTRGEHPLELAKEYGVHWGTIYRAIRDCRQK